MNIKSLILGTAAAIVAGGAVQAADLPVAEPVDYVKVCDAYGAGYFFIPGTDTCLKIGGKVLFGIASPGFNKDLARSKDLVNFYTETTFKFTAREETELGTLTAHMEFDDKGDGDKGNGTAIDKAYITLGGFYAGLTDSLLSFNAGHGYDDYGILDVDLNTIGYKADMGNGVTAAIALEEYTGNVAVDLNSDGDTKDTGESVGTSMPAIVAKVTVDQGWGTIQVGGSVFQVRYNTPNIDTDYGYTVGGQANFNIAEGLKFGVAGGYSVGGSWLDTSAVSGKLNTGWAASAGLEYAFADNFTVYADAGYKVFNDRSGTTDWKGYGFSAKAKYFPVKNLSIAGKVGYQKVDLKTGTDWDDVAAKLEIERSF